MQDYVLYTDATADLPQQMIEELAISVIPMEFTLGEKTYTHYPDARELDIHTFYEKLRDGEMSKTALINSAIFVNHFEPLLQKGLDIIYIAFSSGLSGTYGASVIAAEELMTKYPERKVYCLDSLCASAGEGMLVYHAALRKKEGLTIDDLKNWVLNNRLRLCHWFTVDDLNHLRRGGRVSAVAATFGTALSIKPVLNVDNEGHLIPVSKVRGRKKSIQALMERMEKTVVDPGEQVIFIGHGDSLDDARALAGMIRETINVKDIVITDIGPIIGAHTGAEVIALFFFGTER